MPISEEQVRHVATLARLDLSERQVSTLAGELSGILDHVGRIQELDLEDVEPTAHAIALTNSAREDQVRPCLSTAEALLNAPDSQDGAFEIPRIVGVGGEDA